jgi:flavodoxin
LKILVTYFTQTGNTGKIAQAIFDEVSKGYEADLKKIEEVNVDSFDQYDLVFIGAPCQMGDLAAPVKKILDSLPKAPKFKLAGFFTHGAPPEEKEDYEKCLSTFKNVCQERQIDYQGCYDCQGFPTPKIHQIVTEHLIKRKGYTEERAKQRFQRAKEHPNHEDEQNARKFVRNVLSQI